jgi:hypothetical protein
MQATPPSLFEEVDVSEDDEEEPFICDPVSQPQPVSQSQTPARSSTTTPKATTAVIPPSAIKSPKPTAFLAKRRNDVLFEALTRDDPTASAKEDHITTLKEQIKDLKEQLRDTKADLVAARQELREFKTGRTSLVM